MISQTRTLFSFTDFSFGDVNLPYRRRYTKYQKRQDSLNIVINIHLICSVLDPLILKLIASIGGGLSWVAIVTQVGMILGLIRRVKVKKP
jgi:hypothetical protein